jgi:hypothetical protein
MSVLGKILYNLTYGKVNIDQQKKNSKTNDPMENLPKQIPGTDLTADQAQAGAVSNMMGAADIQQKNIGDFSAAAAKARQGMSNAYDVGASDYTRQAARSLAAAQAQSGGMGGATVGAMRDIGAAAGQDMATYRANQGNAMGQFDLGRQQQLGEMNLDLGQQKVKGFEYALQTGTPQEQAQRRFMETYLDSLQKAKNDANGFLDSGESFIAHKNSLAANEPDLAVRQMILNYGV